MAIREWLGRGGLWAVSVGCFLLSLALGVDAEIYQWRDASGKLHFSDKKPPRQAAEEIATDLQPVNVDDSGAERARLERLFKPETAAERAVQQRQAQLQKQQQSYAQQRCEQARTYLAALQGRVSFVRDDGSSYTISEAERRQQAAAMEAQIREYCP